MKIGIDLGRTIYDPISKLPFAGAFDVIKRLTDNKIEVFIISRVNGEQRERSLKWLAEIDFFKKTGVPQENLYYCWERRDKAIFARALNLEVFIDDRIDVLTPMDERVTKILFGSASSVAGIVSVSSWNEINRIL